MKRVDKHPVQNASSRCCFAHKVNVLRKRERGDYNFNTLISLIGRRMDIIVHAAILIFKCNN